MNSRFGRAIQLFWIIATTFAANLAAHTAVAQTEKPRAVVLAIGIETYKLDHLNRLEWVAEDALAVVDAIADIAEIDTERSRILISDRTWQGLGDVPPAQVAGIAIETHPDGITRAEVQDSVEMFLSRVDRRTPSETQPEELVFIYLGGHGDTKEGSGTGVSFLPSNFEEGFRRDYPIQYLEIDHDNGPKFNNTIIILNMCKAGALPGSAASESKTEMRERIKSLSRGSDQRHFIPAAVGDQSTFEWPGRGSLLAMALTDVLKYATEPERSDITLGSLWTSLSPKMSQLQREFRVAMDWADLDLVTVDMSDQLSESARSLAIGRTNEFAARQSQLMGEALASLAFDAEPDLRTELFRLAARMFGRTADLSNRELARNRLWQGRAHLAAGEDALAGPAFEAANRAADAGTQVEALFAAYAPLAPVDTTLIAFEELNFRVQGEWGDRSAAEAWASLLERLPAIKLNDAIELPRRVSGDATVSETTEMATRFIEELPDASHLVIYMGGSASADGKVPGMDPIEVINQTNLGGREVTIIINFPFAPLFVERLSQELRNGASILTAVSQPEGITFLSNGEIPGSGASLIDAVEGGLGPEAVAEYNRRQAAFATEGEKWRPGTLGWYPARHLDRHPFEAGRLSRQGVSDLDAFALWMPFRVASDVPIALTTEERRAVHFLARPKSGGDTQLDDVWQDLYDMELADWPVVNALRWLRTGAITELKSEPGSTGAFEYYDRGHVALSSLSASVDEDDLLHPILTAIPDTLLAVAQDRFSAKVQDARVRPLILTAMEYDAPEIPDLGRPCQGTEAILSRLADWKVRGTFEPAYATSDDAACAAGVLRARNRDQVLSVLSGFAENSWETDLLIVVLSGRGAMIAGEPGIVLEEAALSDRSRQALARGPIVPFPGFFRPGSYVALSEIGAALGDRDAVIVLDAQFAPSDTQAPRLDDRYVFPQYVASMFDGEIPSVTLNNDRQGRHLLVWTAGTVGVAPQVSNRSPEPLPRWSLLLSRLFFEGRLSEGANYGDWIAAANGHGAKIGLDIRDIEVSGPSHRIAFAAGREIDQLSDVLSGRLRVRANLYGAFELAKLVRPGTFIERLAQNAIYCAGLELDPAHTEAWREDFARSARQLAGFQLDVIEQEDIESYSYWSAEVFDVCLADPEQALTIHQEMVAAGRYPPHHSEILLRLAQNTVQQAAKAKIKRLLNVLERDSEALDPSFNDIVPQIRALAQQ